MTGVVSQARWRRPVQSKGEECGTSGANHFQPGWRPIRHWLVGEHAEEDMQRIAQRMVCWQCLTPFPYPPCSENYRAFKREAPDLVDWHPTIPMIGEARIKASCCPICDAECSPQMLREQIDFTPGGPQRPGAPNYITDDDRDRLEKRHQAAVE